MEIDAAFLLRMIKVSYECLDRLDALALGQLQQGVDELVGGKGLDGKTHETRLT